MVLEERPVIYRKYNNGKVPTRQILFISQRRVAGDKHIHTTVLGSSQQFPVLQVASPQNASRKHLMTRHPRQQTTHIVGQVLIKKDLHATCSLRCVTANASNASIVATCKSG